MRIKIEVPVHVGSLPVKGGGQDAIMVVRPPFRIHSFL